MVDDRLQDGVRIAQLLASEISGDAGRLRDLQVTDADPDVEPTLDGALAYRIVRVREADAADGPERCEPAPDVDEESATADAIDDTTTIAEAFVQPDRVRLEFRVGVDAVAEAAEAADLRVRPKSVRPPRTIVFLEDGAAVKRVRPALDAASESD
ncbi:hypothetical protein SAMN05192561_12116 [Halopenitus malekzadehii]|uniref:DUF7993 domain-containing protein n=1 Tax=Halopenitus malekzadehii TaxID=1267564 RepID=A0A1H6JRU8_9EURY|nr:hypothetical protein [Halopenitus malekzadehii]SEH65230.1 hypothetical protein SAMN05192561_12116 [Halopenitus malekzadehii]